MAVKPSILGMYYWCWTPEMSSVLRRETILIDMNRSNRLQHYPRFIVGKSTKIRIILACQPTRALNPTDLNIRPLLKISSGNIWEPNRFHQMEQDKKQWIGFTVTRVAQRTPSFFFMVKTSQFPILFQQLIRQATTSSSADQTLQLATFLCRGHRGGPHAIGTGGLCVAHGAPWKHSEMVMTTRVSSRDDMGFFHEFLCNWMGFNRIYYWLLFFGVVVAGKNK